MLLRCAVALCMRVPGSDGTCIGTHIGREAGLGRCPSQYRPAPSAAGKEARKICHCRPHCPPPPGGDPAAPWNAFEIAVAVCTCRLAEGSTSRGPSPGGHPQSASSNRQPVQLACRGGNQACPPPCQRPRHKTERRWCWRPVWPAGGGAAPLSALWASAQAMRPPRSPLNPQCQLPAAPPLLHRPQLMDPPEAPICLLLFARHFTAHGMNTMCSGDADGHFLPERTNFLPGNHPEPQIPPGTRGVGH